MNSKPHSRFIKYVYSFILVSALILMYFGVSQAVRVSAADGFKINGSTLVSYSGTDKKVIIPSGITQIDKSAFSGNSFIEEVILNDGLLEIGTEAFINCTNLKKVIFPETLTKIGAFAFCRCEAIESVKLPDACTNISGYTFQYCTGLKSVTLGKGLILIPDRAFYGCSSLSSVSFGSETEMIGDSAFLGTALTSLTCPEKLNTIGGYAFSGCSELASIKFNSSLRFIGEGAFRGTKWDSDIIYDNAGCAIKDNILFSTKKWRSDIIIPTGVTIIAAEALSGSDVSKAIIPDTVISIGPRAFSNAYALKELVIPDSVKYIGDEAFQGCESLEKIVLPKKLLFMGRDILPVKEYTLEKLTDTAAKEIVKILKTGFSAQVELSSEYREKYYENSIQLEREISQKIAEASGLYCYIDAEQGASYFTLGEDYDGNEIIYYTLSASDYSDSVAACKEIKKNLKVKTIKSVTTTNAKKVNKLLKDNKSFILKIKSTAAKYDSKISSLNGKLKSINKAGVILRIMPEYNYVVIGNRRYGCIAVKKSGYCSICISEETAKTYNYAVSFINRIFTGINKTQKASATCMNDFSDAMKVYAIASSGYFSSLNSESKFGMVYDLHSEYITNRFVSDSEMFKNLAENAARGVCYDYANYEMLVWSCLGIESWYNESKELQHAWTVVKVKNSDGKIMWVPFDYGIGPSANLVGAGYNPHSEEQVAERYRIYLNGVPSAPDGKNFTDADFK